LGLKTHSAVEGNENNPSCLEETMDSDPESQHVIDTPTDPMDEDNPLKESVSHDNVSSKETLDNVNASEEVIDAAMQKPPEYNHLQIIPFYNYSQVPENIVHTPDTLFSPDDQNKALLFIGDPIFDTISKTDGIIQSSTNECKISLTDDILGEDLLDNQDKEDSIDNNSEQSNPTEPIEEDLVDVSDSSP
ncbi:unnamed protein product, partial [Arabidopsis halleri]